MDFKGVLDLESFLVVFCVFVPSASGFGKNILQEACGCILPEYPMLLLLMGLVLNLVHGQTKVPMIALACLCPFPCLRAVTGKGVWNQ